MCRIVGRGLCQLFQLSFELLLTHTETESYKDLEHPQLGDNTDRDKEKVPCPRNDCTWYLVDPEVSRLPGANGLSWAGCVADMFPQMMVLE